MRNEISLETLEKYTELAARLKEENRYPVFAKFSVDELKEAFVHIEQVTHSVINATRLATLFRNEQENQAELDNLLARFISFFEASLNDSGQFDEILSIKIWQHHFKTLLPPIDDVRKHAREPDSIKDSYANFPPEGNHFQFLLAIDIFDMAELLGIKDRIEVARLDRRLQPEVTAYLVNYANKQGSDENGFTLPLLINIGLHWTRAIIIVSPKTDAPRLVEIRYRDSFGNNKLRDDLRTQIMQAIPDCEIRINLPRHHHAMQTDNWSCGYRALRSLVADPKFPTQPQDANNVHLKELKAISSSEDPDIYSQKLGSFFYSKLLPQHYAAPLALSKKLKDQTKTLKSIAPTSNHAAELAESIQTLYSLHKFNMLDSNLARVANGAATLLEEIRAARGDIDQCRMSIDKFKKIAGPSLGEKLYRLVQRIAFAAIGFVVGVAAFVTAFGAAGPIAVVGATTLGAGLSSYTYRLFTRSYCKPDQTESWVDNITEKSRMAFKVS